MINVNDKFNGSANIVETQKVLALIDFKNVDLNYQSKLSNLMVIKSSLQTQFNLTFSRKMINQFSCHHIKFQQFYMKNSKNKLSYSKSNSPCFLIPKLKGKLNEKSLNNHYPLPNINQMLHSLNGAKVFATLDCSNSFHSFRINPKHQHLTSFSTPFGKYEFKSMPFGVIWMICYMDDLIIIGQSSPKKVKQVQSFLITTQILQNL